MGQVYRLCCDFFGVIEFASVGLYVLVRYVSFEYEVIDLGGRQSWLRFFHLVGEASGGYMAGYRLGLVAAGRQVLFGQYLLEIDCCAVGFWFFAPGLSTAHLQNPK